jgi:hypothetical protein
MRTSPSIFTRDELTAGRSANLLLAWVDAADDVYDAYATWNNADRAERAGAFHAYRAALDREEAAARALQHHVSA